MCASSSASLDLVIIKPQPRRTPRPPLVKERLPSGEEPKDCLQAEALMNRRSRAASAFHRRAQGVKEIREAREKADAARKRMQDRSKEHHLAAERERQGRAAALEAKPNRFAGLSVSDALAAARRLTFIDLEAERKGEAASLIRLSLDLFELFLTVLKDRGSVAVLPWPRGVRDLFIIHPLAMLAMLGSSPERVSGGYSWCPAVPDFRTLYFPWRASGSCTVQRRVLVDR
jgi:hypothetical protein